MVEADVCISKQVCARVANDLVICSMLQRSFESVAMNHFNHSRLLEYNKVDTCWSRCLWRISTWGTGGTCLFVPADGADANQDGALPGQTFDLPGLPTFYRSPWPRGIRILSIISITHIIYICTYPVATAYASILERELPWIFLNILDVRCVCCVNACPEETGLYNATAIHRAQLTLLAETMLGFMIIPYHYIHWPNSNKYRLDHAWPRFPLIDTLGVSSAVTIVDLFDTSSKPPWPNHGQSLISSSKLVGSLLHPAGTWSTGRWRPTLWSMRSSLKSWWTGQHRGTQSILRYFLSSTYIFMIQKWLKHDSATMIHIISNMIWYVRFLDLKCEWGIGDCFLLGSFALERTGWRQAWTCGGYFCRCPQARHGSAAARRFSREGGSNSCWRPCEGIRRAPRQRIWEHATATQ